MYEYTISWPAPSGQANEIQVTLRIAVRGPGPLYLHIPIWRPGRYMPQDFAAGLQLLAANDDQGNAIRFEKASLSSWRFYPKHAGTLEVHYLVYAGLLDAGTTYLAPNLLYLNPINWALYEPGKEDQPCQLVVADLPASWQVATQLRRVDEKTYHAHSYHYLVDAPLMASADLLTWKFQVQDKPFFAHFWGKTGIIPTQKEPFEAFVQAIVAEQVRVFGEWPVQEAYQLLYLLTPTTIRHAVEHADSSMYVLSDTVTESEQAFRNGVYGITAHELFHTWNVKRLRPAALWPYRYHQTPITGLHWFTEGFTCYFEELMQVRAGIISQEEFFRRLSETFTTLAGQPGSQRLSPQQQSENSWHAPSRYKSPQNEVSFYDSGQIIALALDLTLRQMHATTLSATMRALYEQYYKQGLGLPEDGLEAYLAGLTGSDWHPFFEKWVHGVKPPFDAAFTALGLACTYTQQTDGKTAVTLGPGQLPTAFLNDWLVSRP